MVFLETLIIIKIIIRIKIKMIIIMIIMLLPPPEWGERKKKKSDIIKKEGKTSAGESKKAMRTPLDAFA